MKNSDMPANPLIDDKISTYETDIYYGLTKREHFAALAMQSLITRSQSNPFMTDSEQYNQAPVVAKHSMAYADALLAELEK